MHLQEIATQTLHLASRKEERIKIFLMHIKNPCKMHYQISNFIVEKPKQGSLQLNKSTINLTPISNSTSLRENGMGVGSLSVSHLLDVNDRSSNISPMRLTQQPSTDKQKQALVSNISSQDSSKYLTSNKNAQIITDTLSSRKMLVSKLATSQSTENKILPQNSRHSNDQSSKTSLISSRDKLASMKDLIASQTAVKQVRSSGKKKSIDQFRDKEQLSEKQKRITQIKVISPNKQQTQSLAQDARTSLKQFTQPRSQKLEVCKQVQEVSQPLDSDDNLTQILFLVPTTESLRNEPSISKELNEFLQIESQITGSNNWGPQNTLPTMESEKDSAAFLLKNLHPNKTKNSVSPQTSNRNKQQSVGSVGRSTTHGKKTTLLSPTGLTNSKKEVKFQIDYQSPIKLSPVGIELVKQVERERIYQQPQTTMSSSNNFLMADQKSSINLMLQKATVMDVQNRKNIYEVLKNNNFVLKRLVAQSQRAHLQISFKNIRDQNQGIVSQQRCLKSIEKMIVLKSLRIGFRCLLVNNKEPHTPYKSLEMTIVQKLQGIIKLMTLVRSTDRETDLKMGLVRIQNYSQGAKILELESKLKQAKEITHENQHLQDKISKLSGLHIIMKHQITEFNN